MVLRKGERQREWHVTSAERSNARKATQVKQPHHFVCRTQGDSLFSYLLLSLLPLVLFSFLLLFLACLHFCNPWISYFLYQIYPPPTLPPLPSYPVSRLLPSAEHANTCPFTSNALIGMVFVVTWYCQTGFRALCARSHHWSVPPEHTTICRTEVEERFQKLFSHFLSALSPLFTQPQTCWLLPVPSLYIFRAYTGCGVGISCRILRVTRSKTWKNVSRDPETRVFPRNCKSNTASLSRRGNKKHVQLSDKKKLKKKLLHMVVQLQNFSGFQCP